MGALVIVMMQLLTGGMWGLAIRRLSEAAFMALPIIALLFVPVLFGMQDLFPWSRADAVHTHVWVHKHAYLNTPFFVARTMFYFAVVITMAVLLRRWSRQRDEGDALASRRLRILSGGGLILYVLCMNFASTDWVMSLEPEWYSTIFVTVFMAGQFLAALALMTALLAAFSEHASVSWSIPTKVFSRPRQYASRVRYFLDLCLILTVSGDLVRQFTERDFMVLAPQHRRLAMGRPGADAFSVLHPFCAPALAGCKAPQVAAGRNLRAYPPRQHRK
jgi:hypothetical protein